MFEGLLKNKAIKTLFMNQFKSIATENGLKCIVLTMKEGGEFETEVYKEDMITIPLADYYKLINTIKDSL